MDLRLYHFIGFLVLNILPRDLESSASQGYVVETVTHFNSFPP